MRRAALVPSVLAVAVLAAPAAAQEGAPSGQAMVLWEILWERTATEETQAVLRFIAPAVGAEADAPGPEAVQADMDWLCETHGRPLARLPYARTDVVVVSVMDRPVPRGATEPEATQYFGLYRIEDGGCAPQDY